MIVSGFARVPSTATPSRHMASLMLLEDRMPPGFAEQALAPAQILATISSDLGIAGEAPNHGAPQGECTLGTTERRRLRTEGFLIASSPKRLWCSSIGNSYDGCCDSSTPLGEAVSLGHAALLSAFSSLPNPTSAFSLSGPLPIVLKACLQHPLLSLPSEQLKRLSPSGLGEGLHSAHGSICEAPGVSCHMLSGLWRHDGDTVKGSRPSDPLPADANDAFPSLLAGFNPSASSC